MDPVRIVNIDAARPLCRSVNQLFVQYKSRMLKTHVVIISWKNHTPRRVTTTPRTAEETICVMGEVTFMLKNPAMQMRKPKRP
jgi:hypothetical protein